MKQHWRKNQGKDRYFRQAKRDGYRSRSAYKLTQINDRFRLLGRGDRVLDLGAAPGGWSQVATKLVGSQGSVAAVDLLEMEPIAGVTIITGDMLDAEIQERIRAASGGVVDIILCDAAPSTSGIRDRDHALSIELAEMALLIAQKMLKPGGHMVVKVFEGEFFPQYLTEARRCFSSVKPHHPPASRSESKEMYVVAKELRKDSG